MIQFEVEMENVSASSLDEPGGKPPSRLYGLNKTHNKGYVGNFWSNIGLFCNRLCRDVFGHPKNLLDFKRQITRSGPLSVF